MMRPAHVGDECLPIAVEVGAFVATLGVLEVRQRGGVVFASLRDEDAHAQRAVDLGRHVRMGLREPLGGGLCPVVAEGLDLRVGRGA